MSKNCFNNTLRCLRCLGLRNGIKYICSRIFPGNYSIKLKDYKFPIFVRGKTSDALTFWSIFILKEHRTLDSIPNISTIIDAGANVGYASLLFAKHYPNALIVAIEPDPNNFLILKKNV